MDHESARQIQKARAAERRLEAAELTTASINSALEKLKSNEPAVSAKENMGGAETVEQRLSRLEEKLETIALAIELLAPDKEQAKKLAKTIRGR